ncbi:MAG: LPS export ABC transporter ATP-binding protein [Alphaproteobacteria bacterium]|nr:LPS export ABC transporter ATP-binding protein [Alphaproteobacteria bacterium]
MSPEGLSSRSIDQDAATETGLAAIHIGKSYRKRRVVRDVSLTLQRGEIVGLLGPNGAGKTTCFYMITGLVRVDQGQITLDGADVTGLPMYQRARLGVGYLPQEPSIFRGLTVEQNVMAIVELVEKDAKERQTACDRLLAELHIDHLRDSPASAPSGGERRRVEIARALATRPSYMLLDEPFAGIDPIAINDIRELVQFLKNRGIGILITDHNVRETLGIVDRGYIMFDGEVLFSGTPQQILSNPEVRKVYLGDTFQSA